MQSVKRLILPCLRIIGLVVVIQVFAALMTLLVANLLNTVGVNSDNATNYFYFALHLTVSLVVVLTLAFMGGLRWSSRKNIFTLFNIKKLSSRDWRHVVTGYIVYFIAVIAVFTVAQHLFTLNLDQPQELGFSNTSRGFELAFIALVILGPIYEELLIRGFLYKRLRQYIAFYPALFVTSIIFALLHFNLAVMIDTFLLSVIIIVVYEKTKNMTSAIVIHAMKNLTAILIRVVELGL